MTHGELFAGISGFGLGFERADIRTTWRVEIDPFCQRILRHHHRDDLLLSDVCEVGARNLSAVDVITFGSPCQDLSVAGKRAGLAGERSGLFYEAIRIVDECKPTFAVWENVPGALSSASGRDFSAVLCAFYDIGARDIAWRVLDAQYFGVAQRRRRLFVVADFGGERAAQILFEPESGGWDTPPSRSAGTGVAATLTRGAGTAGRRREDDTNVVAALTGNGVGTCGADDNQAQAGHLVAAPLTTKPYADNEAQESRLVVAGFSAGQGSKAGGIGYAEEQAPTLKAAASGTNSVPTVAFQPQAGGNTGLAIGETAPNLVRNQVVATQGAFGVRRLMPVECERLQGFLDGWTAVDGDDTPDSPRYRACGNAVCVNVAQWIGRRIVAFA